MSTAKAVRTRDFDYEQLWEYNMTRESPPPLLLGLPTSMYINSTVDVKNRHVPRIQIAVWKRIHSVYPDVKKRRKVHDTLSAQLLCPSNALAVVVHNTPILRLGKFLPIWSFYPHKATHKNSHDHLAPKKIPLHTRNLYQMSIFLTNSSGGSISEYAGFILGRKRINQVLRGARWLKVSVLWDSHVYKRNFSSASLICACDN